MEAQKQEPLFMESIYPAEHHMRHTRQQKIRIRAWSLKGALPLLVLLILAGITGYTFLTMDYGNVVLQEGVSQFFGDLKQVFFEPRLSGRFTWGTLLQALGVTIALSILTTILGGGVALLLSLWTARNLGSRGSSTVIRVVMSFTRAVPTILWVLIFAVLIGLGPNAAVLGMTFHTVAYLTKVYSESIEEIDDGVIEALKAGGATWWQIIFQAVLPTCITALLSWTFIRFEINFTNAVAVGAAAGAGGLGFQLAMASSFYFDFREIGVMVYLVLGVAAILEMISIRLRSKYVTRT